jgi:hypothetical protein
MVGAAFLASGCGSAIIAAPTEPTGPADAADIETTLFLIGDAGTPRTPEPVFIALQHQVAATTGERVIVFLGDNIYYRGMPPATDAVGRSDAERKLRAQMAVGIETGTPTYFIPGNHDWDFMTRGGWAAIRRQGDYIAQNGRQLARMLPRNGCPGPEVVDVGRRVRLIMLDTQWWVHEYVKPADSTAGCATWTPKQVTDSLASAVASAVVRDSMKELAHDSAKADSVVADSLAAVADTLVNRIVFVLGHHPLETSGEHGGRFSWLDQIFPLRRFAKWLWIPLPGVGSYEAVARREGNTNQDVAGPLYRRMVAALNEAFKDHHPLVYAGGHDHGLEVLRGSNVNWVLVSGGGNFGHLDRVGYSVNTRYANSASGFMRLDILRDGRVRLGVFTVDVAGGSKESYAVYLD